jgi:hypothetical protein
MILTFPGGQQVDVEFDETQHSYVIAHMLGDGEFTDFRPTHGITAPLVTVPKPFLKKWAAKLCTNETLRYVMDHPEIVDRLPDFFQDLEDYENKTLVHDPKKNKDVTKVTYYRMNKNWPWYKQLKAAPDNAAGIGKELGTWLHESIEIYYVSGKKKLPVITPDCQGMWDSFLMFDEFFEPVLGKTKEERQAQCEFLVYSLMFGYSGQGDFRGYINGKFCILDWKSTNRSEWNADGISTDYFYQLGGLAQAEYERTGYWADDLGIVNFDKEGGEPRVIFASEFGMSPKDAARAYISHFNTYHMQSAWDYKFKQR